MAARPEIQIDWKGETHHIRVTNAVIRRIEAQGVSTALFIDGFVKGTPYPYLLAFIIAKYLESAGVKADEDEVFDVLDKMPVNRLMDLTLAVVHTIVPAQESVPGKPAARPARTKARAKKT